MPIYPPPPIPADACNHKGPDGHRCNLPPGHDGLHECTVAKGRGVRKTPFGSVPWQDFETHEWTDAGHRVLDRPAVARAFRR